MSRYCIKQAILALLISANMGLSTCNAGSVMTRPNVYYATLTIHSTAGRHSHTATWHSTQAATATTTRGTEREAGRERGLARLAGRRPVALPRPGGSSRIEVVQIFACRNTKSDIRRHGYYRPVPALSTPEAVGGPTRACTGLQGVGQVDYRSGTATSCRGCERLIDKKEIADD